MAAGSRVRAARAAVVLHDDCEPLGFLQDWFPAAGVELHPFREYAGDILPTDFDPWDAVVVMGGPQAVYAPGDISPTEIALVRRCLTEGLPLLGICLGAQLLAQVAGGTVARGHQGQERGVCRVSVQPAATDDPLFSSIPLGDHDVIQWHGDGITALPDGALLLATGADYPVQAFRMGSSAWGLQWHPEADAAIVTGWAESDGVDPTPLLPALDTVARDAVWQPLAEAFARLAAGAVTTGGG